MQEAEQLPRDGSYVARHRVWLAAVGIAGFVLSGIAAAITAANVTTEWSSLAAAARWSMVAVPIAVGLYAWHQRPSERFGPMLVAAGFAWFLTTLAESSNDVLYSVGRVSGWVVEVWLIWLVLAFPTGRLTTRVDRALVRVAAVLVALLYLPTALIAESYPLPAAVSSCDAACPDNAFFVLESEPAVVGSLIVPLRELITVLLFVAATARLSQRMRQASPLMRRTLGPVLTVAIARLVVLSLAIGTRRASPELPVVDGFAWASAIAVPALAAGFFIGLLQRRLYVADSLQQLALEVRGGLSRDDLRRALSRALEDPSLQLIYWVDGTEHRWVDAAGRRVELPGPNSERYLSEVRSGDRRVAGIVHDSALRDQSEFVQAAASYALTGLENGRLAAKLESSLLEVRASRSRVFASADRERRRIERDLHDGAQQRLVALRIQLELAEELIRKDPVAGLKKLHLLGEEVGATLDEIRVLARGVYPSLLADQGLNEALRAAALRLPMAASVSSDGVGRHSPDLERAVYFCCLEALQNVSKHAPDAHEVAVSLKQNHFLTFEVRDDGPGFDTSTTPAGAGFTNMRDRLDAVGGDLDVRSSDDGTIVTGTVPIRADGNGEPPPAAGRLRPRWTQS